MTLVLYTDLSHFNEDRFCAHLSRIPATLQQKIRSFRNKRDRYAGLVGKLLLLEGLGSMGFPDVDLCDLRYSPYNRPYLQLPVDFNISHSGNLVACMLSNVQRVGIDVEQVVPICVSDFKNVFADDEWSAITKNENHYPVFYDLWTKKEALVKANGKGLSIPLRHVSVLSDKATIEGEQWWLKKIELEPGYAAHVAVGGEAAPCDVCKKAF